MSRDRIWSSSIPIQIMASPDELKKQGNEFFVKGSFEEAAKLYSEAIDTHGATAVLLTNRAAAKIGLQQFVEAREDAIAAIALDHTFMKAYYRKASVEETLGMEKAAFGSWMACSKVCEHTPWLRQQLRGALTRWIGCFRKIPMDDNADFMERYVLLPTSREKLSTMAHLWNESSKAERLSHFHYFLQLVGNSPEIAEVYRSMTPEQMPDMPMHNYVDLPIENIPSWRSYFATLSAADKTELLKSMYTSLNTNEQGLVIQDLSVFIRLATQRDGIEKAGGGAVVPSSGSAPSSSGAGGSPGSPTGRDPGIDDEISKYVKTDAGEDAEAAEITKSLQEWKTKFGRNT